MKKGKTEYLEGQMPMFLPNSDWEPPSQLPDLRGKVKEIALDTETRDISLAASRGPGWPYGTTKICGVSAAWETGAFYAPITHPESNNFDSGQVKQWIEDHDNAGITFTFHNAGYDIAGLYMDMGVRLPRRINDTTAMAVMVNENLSSYSLDNLCLYLAFPGKDESILNDAAAAYGYKDIKANLWRMPAKFVGPYAEADAVATLKVAQHLRKKMEEENTLQAYQLEVDLIPMVFEMRRKGIRLDINRAEQARDLLIKKQIASLEELRKLLGIKEQIGVEEVNSPIWLERTFNQLNIPFNRTPKSKQGKFDSDWMEKHPHWLPQHITHIRQLEIAHSKFLQGFLLDYSHLGRIHAGINQFRNEEGGTRSHRFSYSDPPLQQMYSRITTELKGELVEIIRGCFLPEENEFWGSVDYSQQEFRLMVHFAELLHCAKASMAGDRYRANPSTDFHRFAADITKLPRPRAKDVNFAKAFGAGDKKFALMTGMTLEEAQSTMKQYDEELPFIKSASGQCQKVAERRGYIKLIDGARSHFDFWEVPYRNFQEEKEYRGNLPCVPCSFEEALLRTETVMHPWYGKPVIRAYTHKAFNRLIQGSAARQTKRAMKLCWDENIVPLLQMHDELCFSFENEKQGQKVQSLMESAIELTVPMKTDAEYGINWGMARKIETKDKTILYDASWSSAIKHREKGKWW